MIRSGAFDSLGVFRSQLLAVTERVLDAIGDSRRQNVEGQFDLFGGETKTVQEKLHLPDIPEYSIRERMNMEKEATGLYLSGHPMDDCRELARRKGAVAIRSILDDLGQEEGPQHFQDNQPVCIAGVVSSSKTKTTRNNSLMSYVVVEDDTGAMELLCFQRVLENCGNYLREGESVLVKGKLSVREEKAPQILCDSAYPLESQGADTLPQVEKKAPAGKIYIRIPSMDSPRWTHIQRVLTMFEGTDPLRIRVADSGKLLGAVCQNHPALLRELEETLGKENVVVQ